MDHDYLEAYLSVLKLYCKSPHWRSYWFGSHCLFAKLSQEIAERGYAAHYKYKLGDDKESGLEKWLNRLQEVLKNPDSSAVNFVEDFKLNLYSDEIFVFTPEGDLKSLPKGSTALDFAFHIHSGLGLRTRGIKVNGKIVPLNFKLSSGEQVQIIKSNNSKPSASWLDFVITSKAKSAIRSSIIEKKKNGDRKSVV